MVKIQNDRLTAVSQLTAASCILELSFSNSLVRSIYQTKCTTIKTKKTRGRIINDKKIFITNVMLSMSLQRAVLNKIQTHILPINTTQKSQKLMFHAIINIVNIYAICLHNTLAALINTKFQVYA
jgi:hypothetical protein